MPCMCACVRACVHACVHACLLAPCMRTCVGNGGPSEATSSRHRPKPHPSSLAEQGCAQHAEHHQDQGLSIHAVPAAAAAAAATPAAAAQATLLSLFSDISVVFYTNKQLFYQHSNLYCRVDILFIIFDGLTRRVSALMYVCFDIYVVVDILSG